MTQKLDQLNFNGSVEKFYYKCAVQFRWETYQFALTKTRDIHIYFLLLISIPLIAFVHVASLCSSDIFEDMKSNYMIN